MDSGDENLTENTYDFNTAKSEGAKLSQDIADEFKTPNIIKTAFSLFNARPFLSAALGFIAGIVSVYLSIGFGFLTIIACLAVASVVCLIALKFALEKNKKACAVIFAVFALFGVIRFGINAAIYNSCKSFGSTVTISARVEKVYAGGGNYIRLELSSAKVNGENIKGAVYLYAYENNFNGALPSKYDVISLKATLSRAADLNDNKMRYFGNGIYYIGNAAGKVKITGKKQNFFEKCSSYVANYLKFAVSKQTYGVALAMTLGDVSALNGEVINAFRLSGLAHVFAVSGLHIGLFSAIFSAIAKFFKLKRVKKCLLVLIPTFLYVGICGFSSSATRAFVMLSVAMLCELSGLKNDRLSALSISALLITFVSPASVFGKGWQLSFAALAGIILLCPVLKRGTNPLNKSIGETLAAGLSAQLGTLPILTDMCGYMSIIAPFANLLALPLLSLVYQILAVACIIGLPFFALGATENVFKVIFFLPDNALSAISSAIAAVNYEKLILPFAFGAAAIPYYFALLTLSDLTNLTVKRKLQAIIAFFIAFVNCLPK